MLPWYGTDLAPNWSSCGFWAPSTYFRGCTFTLQERKAANEQVSSQATARATPIRHIPQRVHVPPGKVLRKHGLFCGVRPFRPHAAVAWSAASFRWNACCSIQRQKRNMVFFWLCVPKRILFKLLESSRHADLKVPQRLECLKQEPGVTAAFSPPGMLRGSTRT